jgi:hypothetical protein
MKIILQKKGSVIYESLTTGLINWVDRSSSKSFVHQPNKWARLSAVLK